MWMRIHDAYIRTSVCIGWNLCIAYMTRSDLMCDSKPVTSQTVWLGYQNKINDHCIAISNLAIANFMDKLRHFFRSMYVDKGKEDKGTWLVAGAGKGRGLSDSLTQTYFWHFFERVWVTLSCHSVPHIETEIPYHVKGCWGKGIRGSSLPKTCLLTVKGRAKG